MKIRILIFGFVFLALALSAAEARELVILYTGESHAMLYPCNCPFESDGGIARRATLIEELKNKNPNTLVLDSGNFFAAGLLDEYTQNTELDIKRTAIQLRAMEMMGYDALNVDSDEFNFGRSFLEDKAGKLKVPLLSCNVKSRFLKPYIIKEVGGVKFGIVGVTKPSALAKAGGLNIIEPKKALKETVLEMKKQGANFIVLLSQLGDRQETLLIQEIAGIDIIINGRSSKPEDNLTKIGSTLILRTSWQGRRLGQLTFEIENNKIINYKAELTRLSDSIKDNPGVLAILPRCFSDTNCKKGSIYGNCQDPAGTNAQCIFAAANKVNLLVITPQDCAFCNTKGMLDYLSEIFPGLATSYLYYGDPAANKLIADFGVKGLPAYFLAKEVGKENNFDSLMDKLVLKGDYYFISPHFSGLTYFLNRKKIKGKLDVFLSLYDSNAQGILGNIRELQANLHFLASQQGEDDFGAAKGRPEVEEYLRSVCVQKYYPKYYWDYLVCRSKNINSSWWQDCAPGLDTEKIAACARGKEATALLRENIALNKELEVMFGPLYFMDNQEIFGIQGVPSKEDLKKILKK